MRWKDNGVVGVASNCVGVNPIGTAKRRNKAQKKFVLIPCPQRLKFTTKGWEGQTKWIKMLMTKEYPSGVKNSTFQSLHT